MSGNLKPVRRLRQIHMMKRTFLQSDPFMAVQADRIMRMSSLVPFIQRHIRIRQARLTYKSLFLEYLQRPVYGRYSIPAGSVPTQNLLINICCAHRFFHFFQNPANRLPLLCLFDFLPNIFLFFQAAHFLYIIPAAFAIIPQAVPTRYNPAVIAAFSFQL